MIASKPIETLVEENLHNWTFCVEKLADMLDISPSYLRELCRLHFNMTPHQFIERKRLQRALTLLTQYEHLHVICKMVGYNSVRTFRRAFTLTYGMTPSEYRQKKCA